MRPLARISIIAALLLAGGPQGATGQVGAVLDWISRLSGPGVLRGGIQYAIPVTGDQTVTVTPAAMIGGKVRDGKGVDGDASLTMYTGQVTVDVALVGRGGPTSLLVSTGVAGHRFTGDEFDNFGAFSVPVQAILRQFFGSSDHQIRIGAGWNVFRFGSTAFDPIEVGVEQDAWEWSFGITTAVLFKI